MRTFVALSLLFVLTFISSCHNSDRDDDRETLSARENAMAYHLFDDLFREVHKFAIRDTLLNDTGLTQRLNSCIDKAFLSDTVAVFPLYLTLDYGEPDDTEECDDGFTRTGSILATFTGKYLGKGTKIKMEIADYKKGNYQVEGKITYENLGLDSNGNVLFEWIVDDGRITGINTEINWTGNHILRWVEGYSPESHEIIEDDVFQISGVSQGRNSRGSSFINEIDEPYFSELSCPWFTRGKSTLTVQNLPTRHIDYDTDTACNNVIQQKRANTVFQVVIPY
ncbi:MAG: hypothetical protein Kow0075_11520 [Salibacteraceae bacterium]